MNGQELRIIAAVAILTGTLVIGLDQLSTPPIGNTVQLAQSNSGASGPPGGGAASHEYVNGGLSGEIDPRDNSRMDTRQSRGLSGLDGAFSRTGPPGSLHLTPGDYDSRQDTSRLDTRQQGAPSAIVPSARDETR